MLQGGADRADQAHPPRTVDRRCGGDSEQVERTNLQLENEKVSLDTGGCGGCCGRCETAEEGGGKRMMKVQGLNVKLEEAGEILSGGAGAKVVAREGGRGKKKGSRGRGGVWVEDSCSRAWSRAIPARKSAHLLFSRGV